MAKTQTDKGYRQGSRFRSALAGAFALSLPSPWLRDFLPLHLCGGFFQIGIAGDIVFDFLLLLRIVPIQQNTALLKFPPLFKLREYKLVYLLAVPDQGGLPLPARFAAVCACVRRAGGPKAP